MGDGVPVPISWSLLHLCHSPAAFDVLYWGAVCVFGLFGLGIATRVTGVLSWVLVASFIVNPATSYDADFLLVILAFYLMVGYLLLGQWSSRPRLWQRLLGPVWRPGRAPATSHAATVSVRLIQVHFALVILVSGLHKLQMGDWWAGVAFWYPLHPAFETTRETLKAELARSSSTLFWLSLAQYLVLAWQLTFPLFAWRRGWWRLLLIGGAVVGWLGSVMLYHLPLFGPIFFIVSLSYLTADEWRKLHGIPGRLAAVWRRLVSSASAEEAVEVVSPA
jgi:hypothetical protein